MYEPGEKAPLARVERHIGLDWLRICAFALLIPYHIGVYFSPGVWIVKSPTPVEWVPFLLDALHPWRLPLLFLVSGYASRALLSKLGGASAFATARSKRLLLPLLFGTAVVVAPQGWVRVVEAGYTGSFGHFWLHDWLSFRSVDGVQLPSTEHLWFVTYLWTYSMVLAAGLAFLPARWKALAGSWFRSLATGWRPLLVPLLMVVALRLAFLFLVPEKGNVLTDLHGHISYVPPFLFGFALAGNSSLWPAIRRSARPALAISLACYAVILWSDVAFPGALVLPHLDQALVRSAETAMGWSTSLLLVACADRWLIRDHRLRKPLSQAVFPFYIAHQTIIVLVGWELRELHYSAGAQLAVLVASTAFGCWAFYEIGRRVPLLRPLIGLSAGSGRAEAADRSLAAAKAAA